MLPHDRPTPGAIPYQTGFRRTANAADGAKNTHRDHFLPLCVAGFEATPHIQQEWRSLRPRSQVRAIGSAWGTESSSVCSGNRRCGRNRFRNHQLWRKWPIRCGFVNFTSASRLSEMLSEWIKSGNLPNLRTDIANNLMSALNSPAYRGTAVQPRPLGRRKTPCSKK